MRQSLGASRKGMLKEIIELIPLTPVESENIWLLYTTPAGLSREIVLETRKFFRDLDLYFRLH